MVFWKLIVLDRRWVSVCDRNLPLIFTTPGTGGSKNSTKIERTRDLPPQLKKPNLAAQHVKSGEKKDRKASNKNAWTVTLAAQQKMHGLYWKRYTLFLFFFAIKIVLSTTPNPPLFKIKNKIDQSSLTFIFCLSLACRSQPCQHETAHFCLFHLCWHLAWVPIQLQRYFHDNVYSGRSESV